MPNVRLTAIDLRYILQQVKIGTDYSQLFGALDPSGVREVNGANNNLVGAFSYDANGNPVYTPGANPWGQTTTADTDFLRMTYTNTPVTTAGTPGTTYSTPNANFNPSNPATWDPASVVADASPRLITNLISSSVTDPNSPVYNPAAVAARDNNAGGANNGAAAGGYDVAVGNSVFAPAGTTGAFMGDQGILGGATFNEFFVAFGQFFDHGLDFISKGGGFVAIPLSPSDPLYVDPSDPAYIPGASNIMYLNRARLSNPDTDFNPDGSLKAGVVPTYNNNTGFLVDQSQTYGSHATVNALVRQYDDNGRATGYLITSAEDGNVTTKTGTGSSAVYTHHDLSDPANAAMRAHAQHNMATWADFKFNALRLGLELTNQDSQDLPAIRVDNTGKLLFDPGAVLDGSGHRVYYRAGETIADMAARTGVSTATLNAHDPFVRDATGHVVHTGQNMFADMNPAANPSAIDNAELDIHFVSGDGRTNENIGLTAVHNIWHEEHNLEVANVLGAVITEATNMVAAAAGGTPAEQAAAAAAARDYINEWTRTSGSAAGNLDLTYTDGTGSHTVTISGVNLDTTSGQVAWDGDMAFQSGRLITETEYNHVAINDYVRSLAVLLPEFVAYSTDVHPNVSLEFSQAIFRLGHSMLTEQLNVAVADSAGRMPGDPGYVETLSGGALVNDVNGVAPGDPGYIETHGGGVNLFDAFLNPALYQDLGNAGITLGLLRQQSNQIDEFVTPALQQTLVGAPLDLAALNIARGRDVGLPTLNELRQQVYTGQVAFNGANAGSALAPYTSWQDFGANLRTAESLVNFIAAYARDDGTSGKDWGINEARAHYENGDTGTFAVLDSNGNPVIDPVTHQVVTEQRLWTLADIRATAQAVLDAYHNVPGTSAADHTAAVAFMEGTPHYNEVSNQWEFHNDGDQGFWDIDLWIGGLAEHPTFDGPLGTTFTYIMLDFGERMLDGDRFYYFYRMPVGQHLGDELTSHTFSEIIERTTGLEHVGGAFSTQTGRFMLGNGNDYFNESQATLPDGSPANLGHVIVSGGGGNDYIVGGFGDDYLYGDDGNDRIQGGQGNDNILGGAGDDWIYDDENDDTINGGEGNDHIFAGPGIIDVSHGGTGDDEVHGGDGIDEVYGDDGNDALFGEGDTDLMMGGEGSDYMNGGDGVDEMFGGNGNDWMQGNVGDDNINGGSGNDLLEGGLGATANDGDRLNGDSPAVFGTTIIEWNGDGTQGDMDIGSYEQVAFSVTANLQTSNGNGSNSTLMDTYAYLEGLVGGTRDDTLTGADANTTTSNGPNNYLIGGGGNDVLQGLGGNDFIFGDTALVDNNLHSSVDELRYYDANGNHAAFSGWLAANAANNYGHELRPVFADGSLGHLLGDHGAAGTADRVIMQGNLADYTIMAFTFTDVDGSEHPAIWMSDNTPGRDGEDVIVDVELFTFADGTRSFVQLANFAPVIDSDGGGASAALSVAENISTSTVLTTVHATDANNVAMDPLYPQTLTYSISTANPADGSNADAARFAINASTGELTFVASPNFEAPTDAGGNNVYNVVVQVSDGIATDTQALAVTVTNVNEPTTGSLNITGATSPTATTVTLTATNTLADGDSTGTIGQTWSGGATTTALTDTITASSTTVQTITLSSTFSQSGTLGSATVTAPETAIIGRTGADTINGTAGRDFIFGMGGGDTITGGAGNDAIDGGAGNDRADYANLANLTFDVSGSTILITDTTGALGSDTVVNVETLRFGTTNYGVIAPSASYAGATGAQFVLGTGGNDTLNGGAGSDIIVAGAGDDTITYNVNNGTGTNNGGRDIVDGGSGTDTFVLVANNQSENFVIYTRAEAINNGFGTGLNAGTEIVITRQQGAGSPVVVAELKDIQEIRVQTGHLFSPTTLPGSLTNTGSLGSTTNIAASGGNPADTVKVVGDFTQTTLAYNTITVAGANSTVDITQLTSDHRVVLDGAGSSIIGAARPQDVINGAHSVVQDLALSLGGNAGVAPMDLVGAGDGIALSGMWSTFGQMKNFGDRDFGNHFGGAWHNVRHAMDMDITENYVGDHLFHL